MKNKLKALIALPLLTSVAITSAAETEFTYGGYIKLDALLTMTDDGTLGPQNLARDFYIPSLTPIGGIDEDTQFDFHGKQTRFFFGTDTKLDNGETISTKIEFDFLVTPGGNERISNSYVPRMRHAFIKYGNWLFGQTWTTFQDVGALPETVDFVGVTEGTTFGRQAMIRYTNGNFNIAIENPETTVTPFGGGGRIVADDNAVPDLAANYAFKMDNGNYVKVSALMRQLSYSNASSGGTIDDTASSTGVSLSGRFNFGKDNLKFMLTTGSGLGRYVGLNFVNGAVLDASGQLETIDSTSGFIAWHHPWGDGWRSNFTYSMIDVDDNVALTGTGISSSASTFRANLMYSPVPKLTFGVEYSMTNRENAGGQEGDMSRLQFGAKYAF